MFGLVPLPYRTYYVGGLSAYLHPASRVPSILDGDEPLWKKIKRTLPTVHETGVLLVPPLLLRVAQSTAHPLCVTQRITYARRIFSVCRPLVAFSFLSDGNLILLV